MPDRMTVAAPVKEVLATSSTGRRLVSVKYVAVRDSGGIYRGVLEIAQYLDELGSGL